MINPNKLNKKDLVNLFTKSCRHRHKYSEHSNCFIDEQEAPLREGYLDIEANGLKADFHVMLSYCIKEAGTKKIYGRAITKQELRSPTIDKKIVEECISDMLKFDIIYGYWSTGYDVPFIRTRALKWDIKSFPSYGMVKHKDIYFMARSKLCLHRKSLETVSRILGIPGKNHVDGDLWIRAALQGDKRALGYILDHNKRDVLVLEKVHNRLKGFVKDTTNSL